jgi:hypothetical protein
LLDGGNVFGAQMANERFGIDRVKASNPICVSSGIDRKEPREAVWRRP